MKPFSVQTLSAFTEVVTGGSAYGSGPSIGHYRSGPKLQQFCGSYGIALSVGSNSRVPAVRDALEKENRSEDGRMRVIELMEATCDPRDYFEDMGKLNTVVEYMNKRLAYDNYELRHIDGVYKLVAIATGTVATTALSKTVRSLQFESVEQDFQRAFDGAEHDPEDSITAACSTVESTCKSILDELGVPYPAKQDIRGLVNEVGKHLNLSPARTDLPPHIEHDLRQILGGLVSVTGGIGALRTHAGDAHGRGKMRAPVDARIARLAIHAASTISLFYIETWQRMKSESVKN